MINNIFYEAFNSEWIELNINNPNHELYVLRKIIPWEKIIKKLSKFYDDKRGAIGKSVRVMVALIILLRYLMLRVHSKITSHFKRRCIPPGCVAKARHIQIFLRFRALPAGRLNT